MDKNVSEHTNTPLQSTHTSTDGSVLKQDDTFNPVKGEMALWRAVITQALMDAGSESKKPEAKHEKAKALRWLLGNSDDFITVCLNAGYCPEYVRAKAKKAIERGCVWRQGMEEQRTLRRETIEQKAAILTLHTTPTPIPANSESLQKGFQRLCTIEHSHMASGSRSSLPQLARSA